MDVTIVKKRYEKEQVEDEQENETKTRVQGRKVPIEDKFYYIGTTV